MTKTKIFTTLILTFIVLFAQVGNAAAAPLAQTATDITGTVTGIVTETDATSGVTTVLVTLDNLGVIQTVRISDDDAFALGLLLTLVPPVVDTSKINPDVTVTIPAGQVIPDATPVDEPVHPISALLGGFFGVDASVIDGYHADGFGFGVIAQALWVSRNLTGTEDQAGDASLVEDILKAKQDKDFAAFFEAHPDLLADGATIPTNWGQFRKAFLNKRQNVGVVVSGKAEESNSSVQSEPGNNGNGQGNGNGNGNNNGNGHGNGKEKNKDKGKDH
jgi:hypothetical protein